MRDPNSFVPSRFRRISIILAAVIVAKLGALTTVALATSMTATAAELVVYSSEHCVVSRQFEKEVAGDFASGNASQTFSLRLVDIENAPADVTLSQQVTSTPTFVFVDQGVEIARFNGYPGREHFFRIVEGAADAFKASKVAPR
jgi:thioredoxin-related protein